MNKKGFTLVELLAVIAILAILVIIALPNVLKMFNDAKKNTFMTEARKIYSEAEKKYISNQVKGITLTTYSDDSSLCENGATKCDLDLSGRTNIDYLIKTNTSGKIIYLLIKDENYEVELGDMSSEINATDITSSTIKDTTTKTVTIKTCPDGTLAGDVNEDGKVDSKDLDLLKKHIADNNISIKGGDYNSDGVIDVFDLIRLKKYISGSDVDLAC